ncbi:unnamed protein product [Oppiella nova]|nr:unnamed protein product [Oppiella nova]CAG2176345.1 unnamed protein product [Oppiella nova]
MDVNKDGVLSKEEFIRGFKTDPQILSALVAEQCSTTATTDQTVRNNNNERHSLASK